MHSGQLIHPAQEGMRDVSQRTERLLTHLRSYQLVQDWRFLSDAIFCVTSFPIGLAFFLVAIIGGSVGFALSWLGVGIAVLAWTFAILLWGAQIERTRLRLFLGVAIGDPHHWGQTSGNVVARSWQFIRSPQVWRDVLYLMLLFPVGILELILVFWPLQVIFGAVTWFAFGIPLGGSGLEWAIDGPVSAFIVLIVGLVMLIPFAFLVNIAARLHGQLGLLLLGTAQEEHLTERVEELTESRSAVMRAMMMERRRIERDLHDGAQQQLVSLAMDLGRARERIDSDPEGAKVIIEQSHEQAKRVLTEMRELVRGIHPNVLTDRGLDAAISAVAGRSPVPVDVNVQLRERLPDEIEGAAYFVVVEALTNIAKHANATRARVSILRDGKWLRITVTDDGQGGADPNHGTGVIGLRDRIQALEGTFAFYSPPGRGTRVTVEIPCELSSAKTPLSSGKD